MSMASPTAVCRWPATCRWHWKTPRSMSSPAYIRLNTSIRCIPIWMISSACPNPRAVSLARFPSKGGSRGGGGNAYLAPVAQKQDYHPSLQDHLLGIAQLCRSHPGRTRLGVPARSRGLLAATLATRARPQSDHKALLPQASGVTRDG